MADLTVALSGWERTALAVEKVKDRLRRATAALGKDGIDYAVVGGNAVAEWDRTRRRSRRPLHGSHTNTVIEKRVNPTEESV